MANASLLLAILSHWSMAHSYTHLGRRLPPRPTSFATASSSTRAARDLWREPRAGCTLAAARPSDETASPRWRAREGGWRPTVDDVERISWGKPASKKGKRTGSRGVPHRLNEDERRSFDQARRQGFLQVKGSAWRAARADAPLLNTYRSLMDARGRPATVLHKGADGGDRLVVDLSPLRLPGEFARVGRELQERLASEFDVQSLEESRVAADAESDATEGEAATEDIQSQQDDEEDWKTRPIYQLPPHLLSWAVDRQQGKDVGKFLGVAFDNVEDKQRGSRKPRGVKPGKGRRHGGYGIG